jgi:hypothetical protein
MSCRATSLYSFFSFIFIPSIPTSVANRLLKPVIQGIKGIKSKTMTVGHHCHQFAFGLFANGIIRFPWLCVSQIQNPRMQAGWFRVEDFFLVLRITAVNQKLREQRTN